MEQAELGKRIRQAREQLGLSQEALAERLQRDQKAVSEYENGKRKLPAVELPTLAAILNVPIAYFFGERISPDDLDQLLLHEFHVLPSVDDKQAAIQAVRLISGLVKRYATEG